jgi:putative transposase
MPAVFFLVVRLFPPPKTPTLFAVFERLFRERGLPANIRSDNGVPFASAHALFNLSKLAVWWLRLGMGIERIKPGHPQQNGRHERMHLTLKKEATKPAAANFLQQQARFDKFIEVFNNERPHEALGMKCPADVYQASPRPYQGLPDIDYPFHDRTIVVTHCGRICLGRKKINFSQVFAGQAVGRCTARPRPIHFNEKLTTRPSRLGPSGVRGQAFHVPIVPISIKAPVAASMLYIETLFEAEFVP